MAPSDNQALDDGLLRQYLLGALPEAEAERLDELSIADNEIAARLDAVENDLVDAYVRGQLSEENLRLFNSFYLATPTRRQKVQFAEGLLALERQTAAAPASIVEKEAPVPVSPWQKTAADGSLWQIARLPRFRLQWGLAAASLLLLLAGGYLLFQNVQLRTQISDAHTLLNSADQRTLELAEQLEQERLAKAEAERELQQSRGPQAKLDQLKIVAALLPPPMRGAWVVPTISLPSGADLVVLVLSLESDDFPAYRAQLKDPATNRVLWRSARLAPTTGGERKAVSISFRAGLLLQQNYVVELTGIPSHGAAEGISSYAFRVML